MAKNKQNFESIHREALERFAEVHEATKEQRKLAIEDMRFAHAEGGQWEEDAVTKRKDRPRFTINRVAGAVDQVCGDQRQNRTQIKVRPKTNGSDDVAKVRAGLIRDIENESDAESIYDSAFDETVTGGFGGWRVLTQFTTDETFDQDICIEPIKSAASSLYFDCAAQKYDKRDSMWAFYVRDMSISEFKKTYKNATITDFDQEIYCSANCQEWFRNNLIRVAEYWVVDMVPATIALMSDGRTINKTKKESVIDELEAKGITIIKERDTQIREVKSYIMNGAEILKGAMPWAGKYIPLIPLYGRTFNIEGKEFIRGVVRLAKDPARIYNYVTSNTVETTALTPKDPYWITPDQASGHEARLKAFNTSNSPFMFYNPDPLSPGAPQRTGAPQLQQALVQQQIQSADDVNVTTGIYPTALGVNPGLQSGKAIIAQDSKGDRSTFIFNDNLQKSIKFTGDILDDLLPRIYDTERVIRVLNFDGSSENTTINAKSIDEFNQPIMDEETGEQVIINDLSAGRYETYVESGAAYTTLRQESAQQLIDLATGSPRFEALATDLIAKNLNILESEELTERVRSQMIKEGVVQPTEKEIKEMGLGEPQQPSPEQQARLENIQFQNVEIMARIEKMNAETDNVDAKTIDTKLTSQARTISAYKDLIDAYNEQIETGINLGIDEQMLLKAQQGLIELSQDALVENNP